MLIGVEQCTLSKIFLITFNLTNILRDTLKILLFIYDRLYKGRVGEVWSDALIDFVWLHTLGDG